MSVGEILHEFTHEHSGGNTLDYPGMAREIAKLREALEFAYKHLESMENYSLVEGARKVMADALKK